LEWWLVFVIIMGSLFLLLAAGMPVAFSFLFLNFIGSYLFFGGGAGLIQMIYNIGASVASFTILPIPLFVLMGEVMFHTNIAPDMMDAIDKWLGRIPGRLGLVAVAGGALFSTLTGASMASTAMLGSTLVPAMENRGYKKPMSLGPILGSGGLAVMIPPSALGVLLGVIGVISVGKILISIIIPGLIMAFLYATYIVIRCKLQPSIAPEYEFKRTPLLEKMVIGVRYILPVGFIVFLVVGLIFLGVATPSEAAATGSVGTFILAAIYKRFSWDVVRKSVKGTLRITVMILAIIMGAMIFGQVLAASGATKGLVSFVLDLPLTPMLVLVAMQLLMLFLGTCMEAITIMMITIPMFMPIVRALGFNEVWFAVIMLMNMEIAPTSPPFGVNLFVMKGVAPADTTMGDIYRAALPFIGCDLIAMALVICFPGIAIWLVNVVW